MKKYSLITHVVFCFLFFLSSGFFLSCARDDKKLVLTFNEMPDEEWLAELDSMFNASKKHKVIQLHSEYLSNNNTH